MPFHTSIMVRLAHLWHLFQKYLILMKLMRNINQVLQRTFFSGVENIVGKNIKTCQCQQLCVSVLFLIWFWQGFVFKQVLYNTSSFPFLQISFILYLLFLFYSITAFSQFLLIFVALSHFFFYAFSRSSSCSSLFSLQLILQIKFSLFPFLCGVSANFKTSSNL